MQNLKAVRDAVNDEKRDMLQRGTSYRKTTAVYASRLLNELVSSGHSDELTKDEVVRMVKQAYKVNDERASDVAKSVLIQLNRVRDQERLANYYKKADKMLSK